MHKLLSILLISIPFFSKAQESLQDMIQWAEGQRLSWGDYKGSIDKNSGAAASTATYLGIDYNFNPTGLTYRISCTFSRSKSWGLHKTDYILSHEQAHFDIAEIFARKLNQRMADYHFNRTTYKTDLRKIYEDIVKEKDLMQNQYDEETNHSINRDKQSEWLKKISDELTSLDDYKVYN